MSIGLIYLICCIVFLISLNIRNCTVRLAGGRFYDIPIIFSYFIYKVGTFYSIR